MPYNLSREAILRHRHILDAMAEKQPRIPIHDPSPSSCIYKMREAFASVEHFKDEFPQYANLKANYKVSRRDWGMELRYVGPVEPATTTELPTLRYPEITQLAEVVGACIKLTGKCSEVTFPNARLTYAECVRFYKWTLETPWFFMYLGQSGVMVTTKQIDSQFLWHPNSDPRKDEGETK